MTKQEMDKHLLNVYNRSVVFEKGEGVYLYDDQGKKYLDMAAGIAVSAFGYGNEDYKNALKNQIDKLVHISNLFYTNPLIKASYDLAEASGMDKVFFTNSGAEAIEGALKLARKYAYNKNPESKGEIIAMDHSFHGRSMGAVSVTGTKHYREPFEPLISGVSFAEYNNLESVKNLVTKDTCGIIMETIQGEGGIHPATEEFIHGVRKLCDDNDIVLIFDEIQCGMGRTGKMFAYQNYGVLPDIMTSAKALGCGVPVGAFAAVDKVASAMCPGDHGTTYGGNPLATAAVCEVFELFEKLHLLDHVNDVAPYLKEQLEGLQKKYPEYITDVRGLGLMLGMEVTMAPSEVVSAMMEKGVVVISAGTNVIRFVPPLVIEKKDVDETVEKLDEYFQSLK